MSKVKLNIGYKMKKELTENVKKLLDDFIDELPNLDKDVRWDLYNSAEEYAQEVDEHWDGISLVFYTKESN